MPDFSWIAPLRFAYDVIRGIWAFFFGKRRKLSTPEILELRDKWRPQFENYLQECQSKKLRTDIIIRDMRRIDSYPDTSKKKGISPWFRIWLADTYHKGFIVGLDWAVLTYDKQAEQWRHTDRKNGEEGDVRTALVGYIPYEFVESVNWDGDEYYNYPHIFCYFDGTKKQPYERLAFSERRNLDEREYFTEIADYNEVEKLSKKLGISRWG